MRRIAPFVFWVGLFCGACLPDEDINFQSPSFGKEKSVRINGLSFDAMEPFISPDGNYLFFNNLNDGINTRLYYATRINDSVFNFVGELSGVNQTTPPHLDAVADMDANGQFYWTSTRNYSSDLDNLFTGTFSNGTVTNINRVRGNFNKNILGWLVMDHGISQDGQFLYYNNARFDNVNCVGPCETQLGIAKKNSDGTFSRLNNEVAMLQKVINTSYIFYAPYITGDNLELYFTRYTKGRLTPNTTFEICVAIREKATEPFSVPQVLFTASMEALIEAPTLTVDKKIMYYHKKYEDTHKIMMRYRN
ncbi:MAG: hypothetical protein EBR30_16550 [Cytophagia bacterium]|nr:hypothetical protein [Cytophagia bacterium]NBW36595.1 hypothetical protein [Cytophagia bacterium]